MTDRHYQCTCGQTRAPAASDLVMVKTEYATKVYEYRPSVRCAACGGVAVLTRVKR